MAAKQVAKVIDWSQLLQRTTAQNRAKILAFKNKTDTILAANLKAKQQDLTVNWAHYESAVADKALVTAFKKQFQSFVVSHFIRVIYTINCATRFHRLFTPVGPILICIVFIC